MADIKTSVTNMESEDNLLTDAAEGADNGKSPAAKDRPRVKKQRSRVAAKKKERTFDWPKKNLYEATYVDSVNAEEKNLIHRVFVISKIGEGGSNRVEVGNLFDVFIKHLRSDFQTEPITGLMLIYMKHIVHVLECSADMILELMKELSVMEEKSIPLISKSKILVISHDIPHRQYQGWGFRTLDIVEPGLESYEATDTTENLVVDLLTQLLKLGNFLSKQPKLNLKSAMDSLYEKVPHLLPQQAVVHFLLEDNDPCIMTPQEYVRSYEQPFDITLDSDLVWPLPTRLFPYN